MHLAQQPMPTLTSMGKLGKPSTYMQPALLLPLLTHIINTAGLLNPPRRL